MANSKFFKKLSKLNKSRAIDATQEDTLHMGNIRKSPHFAKMAALLKLSNYGSRPTTGTSIALKLGALAVIAYTMAMQVSLHKKVIGEFEKPQNFSLKHIDPMVRAKIQRIQNIDDFNDWADENIVNVWTRFWAKQQAKTILREPTNAAFVLGDIPDRPAILLHPDQRNKKVRAHEIGHYIDAIQHKALTRKKYDKVYGEGRSFLRALFGDPKGTSVYQAEERAWENVSIKAGDSMREKALATYEYDLKKNRYVLPATAAWIAGNLL